MASSLLVPHIPKADKRMNCLVRLADWAAPKPTEEIPFPLRQPLLPHTVDNEET
jgi:hypothetical protein